MFQKTITYPELKHCDILFYRPRTFFGYLIGIFTAILNGKFDRVTFSHVAIVLKNKNTGSLQRFDATMGRMTGFRVLIDRAYVFRFKNLTDRQKNMIQKYCESREGSRYDVGGLLLNENEFCDYCSELLKNALVFAEVLEDQERITPFHLYEKIREKVDFVGLIL